MDKQHLKGEAKKAEGNIKQGVGKLTGNKKLQAEGKLDEAEGEVRKTVGDVKDAFKKK
ncbi:MAG: CsbD family protein [Hyphomonas sp.]|nr:CsbD family protein [Hyphomonas sp.]